MVVKRFMSSINIAKTCAQLSAAEENGKIVRKKNFTDKEVALLLDLAEPHIKLLTSKLTNTVTNKLKKSVWYDISRKINAQGVEQRTWREIKCKWQGLTSGAKNKIAKEKRKIGGGSGPRPLDPVSPKIVSLFGDSPSWAGISCGVESAVPSTSAALPTAPNARSNGSSKTAPEMLAQLATGFPPPTQLEDSQHSYEYNEEQRELMRLVEEASGRWESEQEPSQPVSTDSEFNATKEMAIATEQRGEKGKSKGKGKGKKTSSASTQLPATDGQLSTIDCVKTRRCICPVQHALLLKELSNAALNEKKMKLEILKLEKDLNC
ncbi:nuclear apoptosis-inducing factor 1-like [Lineus longissimus]|uniref:nuclear apoptosis-inducing factor 1-like n=1 Tax=Lineus longissimus TaxID=88925 RepID=UPI00315D7BC4